MSSKDKNAFLVPGPSEKLFAHGIARAVSLQPQPKLKLQANGDDERGRDTTRRVRQTIYPRSYALITEVARIKSDASLLSHEGDKHVDPSSTSKATGDKRMGCC